MPEALKLESLRFATPAARKRHVDLRAWVEAHSAGFQHLPLRQGGNFVTERWCSPAVTAIACEGGSVVSETQPGWSWRTLETLHYPQEWPAVFGLLFSVGQFPEAGAGTVGLRFSVTEDGRTVVGDGMALSFVDLASGPEDALHLGTSLAYRALDTDLRVAAPGSWRDELRRLAASPESLRATATERLDALAQRIEQAFAAGEVKGWDEGEYHNDGIPPERTPRALKPDELARERKLAADELARRRAFVRRNATAMHAMLVAWVPVQLLVRE